MTVKALPLAILLSLAAAFTALAQEETTPEAALERLFEAPELEEDWFAPAFLAEVPAAQVASIVAGLEQQYGSFQSVTGDGQNFTVVLEQAEVPTRLVLNDDGRIIGLLFQPPIATGALSNQAEGIAALPGQTAVLVTSDGEVQAEHNANEPLAVGSAAKLAILKAVAEAVSEGRLDWDRVVPLDPEWRSLPTGILQDWPEGTPLTIATLANLMMSISDNTATDALIRLVGREAVEAVTPRNTPFPTTRELFILKATDNTELRQSWIEGDASARRDILDQIASMPLPDVSELDAAPSVEVEWFFSAQELCTLIRDVANLPALRINSGMADPQDWQRVAFKGGSEAGVLNFTTWLEEDGGGEHCVVATWNNAEAGLQGEQLVSRYGAILGALEQD